MDKAKLEDVILKRKAWKAERDSKVGRPGSGTQSAKLPKVATAGKLARKLDPIVPVTVVDLDGPVVRTVGFPCAPPSPIVPRSGVRMDSGVRIDWKKSRPYSELVQLDPEQPGLFLLYLHHPAPPNPFFPRIPPLKCRM